MEREHECDRNAAATCAEAVFMREALSEAAKAAEAGEIPIGAVVEKDGLIIGRGRNRTETEKDPTAHAEIEAIKQAAKTLGAWRLTDCRMYVTTEPCAMCAGALVLARVDKVYIGALNVKGGACVSLRNLLWDDRLNHRVDLETGVLRDECEHIIKEFFARLRAEKRMYSEDEHL
ncbi:MAG: tRNA adenosine(34) deaminase TadA [Clostridiales Family XIII bacterium]|jgi:tRNA(adenine34) deaminase|nr:tRNA adenosine(34) deaminase TadA [Clostridiales Family XIII bacterium]